ncbi:conjugal transfer protein MobA [uncultured Polaribacter sp.]|uniref:conjugal transfer protein MobA n=1 Tax=uncultured Polaribacter sp. TaxID=174711 RepID=UPI0026253FEE|nr:conjugal transfer protein MobA [uncultured Polaribacter sp.]
MKKENTKKGRKPKENPLAYRYVFRLNATENAEFLKQFEASGLDTKAKFIRAIVFEKEIKVVKIDKSTHDYYMRLTSFYAQFRAIGVNYNQTVKALHTTFTEKKAQFLLLKLEKLTIELIMVSKEITHLTQKFKEKWLQK